MKLLAIETATEACSAAISIDGAVVSRFEYAPRRHGDLILAMVDELMAEAQVDVRQFDALAFGTGPGSFIGVRIAAAVSQGIAFAADLPVVPVSTLKVLAQTAVDAGVVEVNSASVILAAIDARMSEIYWGQYRIDAEGLVQGIDQESLVVPSLLPGELKGKSSDYYGVGSGWQTYLPELGKVYPGVLFDEEVLPKADSLIRLATVQWQQQGGVNAMEALPTYLRNKVANKPKKKD